MTRAHHFMVQLHNAAVGAAAAAAFVLLGAGGCGKRADDGLSRARATLSSAGVRADGFGPTEPGRYAALRCEQGRLEGLDALLCEYRDATVAHGARARVESFVGDAETGLTLERGAVLLAVADRERADPGGRTIQKIATGFNASP